MPGRDCTGAGGVWGGLKGARCLANGSDRLAVRRRGAGRVQMAVTAGRRAGGLWLTLQQRTRVTLTTHGRWTIETTDDERLTTDGQQTDDDKRRKTICERMTGYCLW